MAVFNYFITTSSCVLCKNIGRTKELKEKKIAGAKGSGGFDFLHKALKYAGISSADMEMIQLQPDEAMPTFENGAAVFANGETIDTYSPGFTIVRSDFADSSPKEVKKFLQASDKAVQWQKENKEETVAIYAKVKDIDPVIVEKVLNNTEALNEPITEEIIQAQQETADFQYKFGAIDKKIDVSEVVDNQFIEKVKQEPEEAK